MPVFEQRYRRRAAINNGSYSHVYAADSTTSEPSAAEAAAAVANRPDTFATPQDEANYLEQRYDVVMEQLIIFNHKLEDMQESLVEAKQRYDFMETRNPVEMLRDGYVYILRMIDEKEQLRSFLFKLMLQRENARNDRIDELVYITLYWLLAITIFAFLAVSVSILLCYNWIFFFCMLFDQIN